MEREQVLNIFADILAEVIARPREEIIANPNAKFSDDLGMTSVEYFPLICTLEEKLNVDVDFSEFLMSAHSLNEGTDFMVNVMNK